MPQIVTCPACGGQRGTEKTQHTVITDEKGNQTHQTSTVWTPCSFCSGSGTVVQG